MTSRTTSPGWLSRLILLLAVLSTAGLAQPPGKPDRASKALEEGDRLLRTGFPVLAIRQYGEALKAGAPRDTVNLRIVHAHCATGDYTSAGKVLDGLSKSHRPTAEILLLKARIRFWQHRYDVSWKWFRDYLKEVPGDSDARMDYALSLAWGRQFDDALVEMKKLEKTNRFRLEAKFRHAEILAWKKMFSQARAMAGGLLRLPRTPLSLKARCTVLIGRTLAWQKKFERAEAQYRTALELHPHFEEAWLALGEVQEWQGKREEARAAYARALQVAPSSKKAQSALKRLTGK